MDLIEKRVGGNVPSPVVRSTASPDNAPLHAGCSRVSDVRHRGSWDLALESDFVLIDFDRRFRRRFLLETAGGRNVLLDLPQAVRLRDGDGLALEDGGIVRVRARPENLLEITASDHALLLRIAWHLGNRHLPVQFLGDILHIRADHVIADMVTQLGGKVRAVEAPFDPEAGAYAADGGAHHHHHHDDAD
jgi:urease accessory protein